MSNDKICKGCPKVFVALTKEACNALEEMSMDQLMQDPRFNKDYDWVLKDFNTNEEAEAFIDGINLAAGYDNPSTLHIPSLKILDITNK